MNLKTIFIGSLVAGLVLFFWSGLTQLFPWGVPSATVFNAQSAGGTEIFQATNIQKVEPYQLTTPAFDTQLVGRVSTLTTDQTFSWIVTNPLTYYNPTNYFLREILTQLLVGILLTLIAYISQPMARPQRLMLFGLASIAAALASYGQLLNWWGLTFQYGLGVSLNLITGWLLVGFILVQFVIKSQKLKAD